MKEKYYTVVFPYSEDKSKVLLGLKKRGMGQGLWNGFGGKLELGESMSECAARELKEECGLDATDLQHVSILHMYINDGIHMIIYVYTTCIFTGNIKESDEMYPRWFVIDELDYKDTYQEAIIWWPYMFSERYFISHFYFNTTELLDHRVDFVERDMLPQ